MDTFEDKGDDLHLPDSLLRQTSHGSLAWAFVWYCADFVAQSDGWEKVVEHLASKPENVMVFGDGLNDLELLIMLESALQWNFSW